MTRYGRNIFQDLANFSNKPVDGLSVGRLAGKYAGVVEERKRREVANSAAFDINVPHMEMVKKRIAEQLEAEAAQIQGTLPVAAIYDAFTLVKNSSRRDAGVNALQGQLEHMWKRDRTGSITANLYLTLHDHYKRNYPRSAAAELIQQIGEQGYSTLPVSDLEHIASKIQNQGDFDHAVMLHGLNGPLPHQVKARRYLLALLNQPEDDDDDEMEANAAEQLLNHVEEMEEIIEEFAEEEGFEVEEEDDRYEVEDEDEDEEADEEDEGGESDEPPFTGKASGRRLAEGGEIQLPDNVWEVEFNGLDGYRDSNVLNVGVIANMDYATNWGGPVAVYISGWESEQKCLEEAWDMMVNLAEDRGDDPYGNEEDGPNFDGYSFTTTVEAFKAAALESGDTKYQEVLSSIEEELADLREDEDSDDADEYGKMGSKSAQSDFMQPVVQFGEWYELETEMGTEVVPGDLVGSVDPDDDVMELFGDYIEGDDIYEVQLTKGYGARLSAPGYLDATEWTVFDTEQEAWDFLEEMYDVTPRKESQAVTLDPPGYQSPAPEMINPPLDGSGGPMLEPFLTGQQDDIQALYSAWNDMQPAPPEVVEGAVDKLYTMQGMPGMEGATDVIDKIMNHVSESRYSVARVYQRVAAHIRGRRVQAKLFNK